MKTPANGADIESLRAKAIAQADAGGGPGPIKIWQEPKRKRAYHRALKRGEHWAVWKKNMHDLVNYAAQQMYASVLKPSPFIGLLKHLESDTTKETK